MATPMPDAPCLDCKDRRLGCHSECDKYMTFKAERIELCNGIKAQEAHAKLAEAELINSVYRSRRRRNVGRKF